MWIVFDWHCTIAYGPFNTKEEGEEWLAKQNIHPEQYEEQEVSILQLIPISEKLQNA